MKEPFLPLLVLELAVALTDTVLPDFDAVIPDGRLVLKL